MEDDGDVEKMTFNIFDDLDIPIALRKEVRSCTKHPISNYLGYLNLSHQLKAFTVSIDDVMILRDIYHALQNKKWKTAVMDEMQTLEANKIWDIVRLPNGNKIVGSKWVFTMKYKLNGSIDRYKARLVAQGFTQIQELDYEKTFASVAKLNSIRVLLSLAINLD